MLNLLFFSSVLNGRSDWRCRKYLWVTFVWPIRVIIQHKKIEHLTDRDFEYTSTIIFYFCFILSND